MAFDRKQLLTLGILGIGGYIVYTYYLQSTADTFTDGATDPSNSATTGSVTDTLQTLWETAMNKVTGNWMTQGEGPLYLPYLNATEIQYGIPTNLLARIAYQESHFRADIISGATQSSAGAVGIMQLLPRYFPGAGNDPNADINTAGQYLSSLYHQFGDWQLAVAAYNDGPGNINAVLNGTKTLPAETSSYVSGVFADVPVPGSLIQV